MNPLIKMINSNNPASNQNIMQMAIAAAMSGQTPQQFLATIPQLQGMDVTNPVALAKKLCADRGINYDQAASQIQGMLPKR